MPKRQHDLSYKDGDLGTAGSASPASQAEPLGVPTINREFMLTPAADECLYNAIRAISKATGTTLTNSHFLRILLKVIESAMPEIEREASKLGKLKRPANARDKQAKREEYELRLARAVAAALKSAPPPVLDPGTSQQGRESGKQPA